MRLPTTAHTDRPWRIHELAPGFRVEDVWALPCRGGRDEFPELVEMIGADDPERSAPAPVRALFAIRVKLGELLGWDDAEAGLGSRGSAVRDRLPEDLRATPAAGRRSGPFDALYLLDDEFAAEIANRTVHAIMHLGWVPDGDGGYRGQMAVLVKPNGRLGVAYMAAIKPFRYLFVYPALLRGWERRWERRMRSPAAA